MEAERQGQQLLALWTAMLSLVLKPVLFLVAQRMQRAWYLSSCASSRVEVGRKYLIERGWTGAQNSKKSRYLPHVYS